MTLEGQIRADVQALTAEADAHTQVLTQAADHAATRRMFGVEEWFRYCAGLRPNLAGPVPAEYTLAVDTAHLIMEGRTG